MCSEEHVAPHSVLGIAAAKASVPSTAALLLSTPRMFAMLLGADPATCTHITSVCMHT